MIITAKEKPASNKIYFTYDSSTVTPYYQPPFTDEYRDGWNKEFGYEIKVTETQVIAVADEKGIPLKEPIILSERPDYVVGSIAFYADGKANYEIGSVNYATGKIGNLYAMKCNGEWCRWTVEGQYIVLSIPQTIIDGKVYPVVIAPVGDTFGYTTQGGSSLQMTAGRLYSYNLAYSPSSNGTATSLHCYTGGLGTSANGKMGLYIGTDLITNGESNSEALAKHTQNQLEFASNPSVASASSYYIAVVQDGNLSFWYDDVTNNHTIYADITYANPLPDPITWTTATSHRKMSLWCTYTPSASYDISSSPTSKALGILADNTTYYFYGSAPSNPITDGECYFTFTNNGGQCDIDTHGHAATGGVGATLTSGAPSSNTIRITVYYSGQDPASGIILTTSDQEFRDAFAASATLKWDGKFEIGTATDGEQKTLVITFTAVVED
jgi:hypothetical protein